MLKLFVMLLAFLLMSLAVMGMRHHARELDSQTARLVDQVEDKKQKLWDQDPKITAVANPRTLAQNLKDRGIIADVGVVDGGHGHTVTDDPGDLVGSMRHRQ